MIRVVRFFNLPLALAILFLITISCPLWAQTETTEPATWAEQQRKAVQTFYKLDQSNNYTESLQYADMNVLPIGIKQTLGNIEVTIAVSDMRWEKTHSELTLFARVKIPDEQDRLLYFGAQGVKLSHTGDIIGDASLVLMGDVPLSILGGTASLTLLGSFDNNTGRAKELTYVSVDCQGFREMGIAAEVAFPENLLVPVTAKGDSTGGKVKARFNTVVKDWSDILASVSLPPFMIKGLKGFVFTMSEAVFDQSDKRNDPNIVYPAGYQATYMIPGNEALWRGVYIRDLSVTLPKPFSDKSDIRPSFGGHNMLIDNNGVSGIFSATGVLPIDRGSASGWRFSVDQFSLALEANHLTEAKFSGQIGLPVTKDSTLGYDAVITANDEYVLKAKVLKDLRFDVLRAQAHLLPNSYIEFKVIDDKFKPEAMLHGTLSFAARLDGSNPQDTTKKALARFNGIEFRSLHLKTDAPRFTAEYFGYKGEIKLMNFPISVSNIGVRAQETEVALMMDINLTLSDNMFAGSTRLEFVGELKKEASGNEHWQYKTLKVSKISVDAQIAGTVQLKASLEILNDDPIYGDGYAGELSLTFSKVLEGMNVTARGMFGRKDFRYWFVDGRVKFPGSGLEVFPPTVFLQGFGGGISYHMKRDGVELAASPTGVKYVPDANTGLGLKSSVLFNIANENAINGEASFEIAFSKSGGLSFAGFYGYAKFMAKIPGAENVEQFVKDKAGKLQELEKTYVKDNGLASLEALKQYDPSGASLKIYQPSEPLGQQGFSAAMGIQYDFEKNSLHSTFDLYVTYAGGLVRGAASNNRAGWAVLHIDKKEWYLHMGTPTDRLGLKMGIAGISIETGSYLMMGSRIPASPPPPQEVADILKKDMAELDYMRDFNALGDGKGFALGASLKVATGDISFLILYANFQAGVGFDIMLKQYENVECYGRSGPVGMDGWYANGQSYVYLQGELGVKVNLWFLKTKVPIIQGAAAALLQAQLPNPVYLKGYLRVEFDVLGGLVSGSCNFKLTIGEKCDMVIPGGSPLDMRMISDLTPANNAEDVDVFTAPQAAFTMPVGKTFTVEGEKGAEIYRISLTEFSIKDNGKAIPGELTWNSKRDAASFLAHEVLPPNRKLHLMVRVGFEQWVYNKWVVVYTAGQKAEEYMERDFITGTAPDNIPVTNVAYSYPVMDQKYFLKDEFQSAYIQLKQGQSYLFSKDFKHEVHITESDGTIQPLDFVYNSGNNRLTYTLPPVSLQTDYAVNIVTLKKPGQESAEATTVSTTTTDSLSSITVKSNQAASVIRSDVGKVLLGYPFSTSRYATLKEKIDNTAKVRSIAGEVTYDVFNLQYDVRDMEPFEAVELVGSDISGGHPLVSAVALLDDAHYTDKIYPMLYKNYPVGGIRVERDKGQGPSPAAIGVVVSTNYQTALENGDYVTAGSRFPYIYDLFHIYKQDYTFLRSAIVNRFLGTKDAPKYEYIMTGTFPFMSWGYYNVQLQYSDPQGSKGTTAQFQYYNFIK